MRKLLALALVMSSVAVGCGGGESGPPEIALGRTECDECHMIIDDLRFAGAYRLEDGTEKRFDDIGDMVSHGLQRDELDRAEVWVWDHGSTEPVKAPEATYVVSPELVTPMAWGVAAYADRSEAEALAEELGGEVVSWSGLRERVGDGGHL